MAPDRVFLETQVEEIILPTNTGQMGVLSNHTPLLTGLDIGVMLVREKSEWDSIALMGGFALIKDNKVTILVNEAEDAANVDSNEAEASLLAAQTAFEKADNQKEKIETNLALKRAKVRVQLSQT